MADAQAFARMRQHSSSDWEQMMRFRFLADLLEHGFVTKNQAVTVLQSAVDAGGYDLVLVARRIARFIQLKTASHASYRQKRFAINQRLLLEEGSCAILMLWNSHDKRMDLTYAFLDVRNTEVSSRISDARTTLGRWGRDTKRKTRPWHKDVPGSSFQVLGGIDEVYRHLFGGDGLGGLAAKRIELSGIFVRGPTGAKPFGGNEIPDKAKPA